jgi:hypothetical protein
VRLTSRPPKRWNSRRTAASCRSSSSRQPRSPRAPAFGRVDDIREQHRRERPVDRMAGLPPSQEFLDFVHDAVDAADERVVLIARELDEASTRDVLGQVAAALDRGDHVVAAMQNQRRGRDRRERGAHVDLSVPPHQLARRTRGCGEPLEAREPAVKVFVLAQGWRDDRCIVTAPPGALEVLVHELQRGPRKPVRPARGRPVDDQRLDQFRVGGREERGQRPSFRRPQQRRPAGSNRLHHGADVVHALLGRRRTPDAIRKPGATLVEHHHPGERRQALERAGEGRQLPVMLDLVPEGAQQHQIEAATPSDARSGSRRCSAAPNRGGHFQRPDTRYSPPRRAHISSRARACPRRLVPHRLCGHADRDT